MQNIQQDDNIKKMFGKKIIFTFILLFLLIISCFAYQIIQKNKVSQDSLHYTLPKMQVNLNPFSKSNYVEIVITLEVEEKKHLKSIKNNLHQIAQTIIVFLSQLTDSDLERGGIKIRLQEQIQKRINVILNNKIKKIYLNELFLH